MKKRLLSILLMLCMTVTLLPGAAWAAEPATSGSCGENVFWSLNDGVLTISGTGPMGDDAVPWWYLFYYYNEPINAVIINSGVTHIGDSAFNGLLDVPRVDIPSSVISIGAYAFSGCGITEITIPSGVTSIGENAFDLCENLTSVIIPDSVTSIGQWAFSRCYSLTDVTIPSGVTYIEMFTFCDCKNLTSVTIPVSVTSVHEWAFAGCDKLSDIYYGGSESQWQQIDFHTYEDIEALGNVTIHYNSAGPSATEKTVPIIAGGNTLNVLWDDEWFNDIPTYNHDLAVTSAALSWAVYSKSRAESALEKLQFTNIASEEFDNHSISSEGHAAYTIGEKQIVSDGQSYKLIAILIRGSSNSDLSDWVSNFLDSGLVDGDSGFEDAARSILEDLSQRYDVYGSGNVKFLITGHSRGAIIANLIAAELTQHGVLDGAVDRSFGAENVFSYTFASPLPSRGAPELLIGNIYNIINPLDLVPKAPPTGESRYGIDLILPCKKTFDPYYTEENGIYTLHTYDELLHPVEESFYKLKESNYDEWDILEIHAIAAYYSWLSSYTAEELFGQTNSATYPTFKHIQVACPVNVYVYDEAGSLLVSVENDEIRIDKLEVAVADGVKDIYLPSGHKYDVQIVATDMGSTKYSVEEVEVSGAGDKVLRTVSFNDIDIVAGDTLTGFIDDAFSVPAVTYALTQKSGATIEAILPDYDSTDSIVGFSVTFEPNGGSLTTETVAIGEDGTFSELPSASREGYTFDGWYTASTDGDKITTDTVFDSNTIVYAHWIRNSTEHTHSWSTAWSSDAHGHWHNCTAENCPITTNSQKDGYAPHTSDDGKITTKPTLTTAGIRTYSCTVCGYVIKTETIPATGGGSGGTVHPAFRTYPITLIESEHGAIKADPTWAMTSDRVTLTVTPDYGYVLDSLAVIDNSGIIVTVTDSGDGTYSFTMPQGGVTVSAVFKLKPCDGGANCPSHNFTDVNHTAWYHEGVDYAMVNGLMVGKADGIFDPDGITTRAEIVTTLYRLDGEPAVTKDAQFDDVPAGLWYSDAINWAAANEIAVGYGDGKFGPNDTITREQMAAILYRYASYKGYDMNRLADLTSYTDAGKISSYAVTAMQWAVAESVIVGTSTTTLSPSDGSTRAQVAAILMRFREKVAK